MLYKKKSKLIVVIKLDFYFLKYYKDKDGFGFWKRIGMNVVEIQEPEKIDEVIDNLDNNTPKTIILKDELASFSNSIISKYKNTPNLNIIIVPNSNTNKK